MASGIFCSSPRITVPIYFPLFKINKAEIQFIVCCTFLIDLPYFEQITIMSYSISKDKLILLEVLFAGKCCFLCCQRSAQQ